ncbi:unnamed protein product [Cylicocyclus nassatus]|uniref:Fas-binding factor 1 C-terminal domain-containing protein n=1 Tax=Cylicocyclus nassatus TaxID=53992 RepID=A0AA36HEK4_CYLNA|nr:unnamed protein product [Cylicocyclus nassatus]
MLITPAVQHGWRRQTSRERFAFTRDTFAEMRRAVTFARGQVRPSYQKDDVMADDSLGDLLGDMDDLDNALFGRSTGPKTKPSLGNLDSLFGETKKTTAKKSSVSFLDTPTTSASGASHPPTKSTLDELFADTSSDQKSVAASASTTQAVTKPSRLQSGSTSLGNLLGPTRRDKETKPGPPIEQAAPVQAAQISAVVAPEDALRTKRLENEVERLNREIEDLKRRKKDDEQDIEKLWKEKLAKRDREHQDEIKDLETAQQKQLAKLENEHTEEIDRLRMTYERQLETIQQSASQWKDVSSVVDKVDSLSTTINQLANNVTTATERALLEKETELRMKEQRLENTEQSLLRDKAQFEDERNKVYELNAKLNELCKGQESVMEQDKYRVREEWNRLNAEKAVFKEDQRFILENIEKQKAALDKSKTAFLQEQHDLLVRVSTERQLLEQERNEFHGKRSIDVRRLKEEAGELQRRAQNVLAAERQVDELKTRYETKMRQLQELEITLMEECVEMENLRNHMSTVKVRPAAENGQFERPTNLEQDFALTQVEKGVPAQNESVRTVLKKHSEFLERYMGQKVAAVAPRPARFDSP